MLSQQRLESGPENVAHCIHDTRIGLVCGRHIIHRQFAFLLPAVPVKGPLECGTCNRRVLGDLLGLTEESGTLNQFLSYFVLITCKVVYGHDLVRLCRECFVLVELVQEHVCLLS